MELCQKLPSFLVKLIEEYVIYTPKNKQELIKAVDFYLSDETEGIKKYGHISNWNTINITDMSYLFHNCR